MCIIADLCQFYYYELHTHSKLASFTYHNGRYDKMAYFDNYWAEDNRFPYLIYHDNIPVGFILVHDITVNPNIDWKLSELFVMAPFQKQGIARAVVDEAINKHPGTFEVSVLKDNSPALQFWSAIHSDKTPINHGQHQDFIFYEL